MKYTKVLAIFAFLFAVSSLSYASNQTLDDDTDFASEAASVFKIDDNTNYPNNLALREARKMGLGVAVGGSLGTYGMNIEVNFEDENSGMAGFGGGDGYNSFHILWKHSFEGDTIAPYFTAGYSRWYNSARSGDYKKSSVLERVLTNNEKSTGPFTTDFLTGAVGLQFTQLTGNMAGTSLYAEIVLLGEVHSEVLVPTGAVGALYYF